MMGNPYVPLAVHLIYFKAESPIQITSLLRLEVGRRPSHYFSPTSNSLGRFALLYQLSASTVIRLSSIDLIDAYSIED